MCRSAPVPTGHRLYPLGGFLAVCFCWTGGCQMFDARPAGLKAGEESAGAWWMQQTALTREGGLDLAGRSWWPAAMELAVGEQMLIPAGEARPVPMLVRREKVQRRSGETEALVWIIDDDADGSAATGGDIDSDCYVVDYGPDGVVDRMVDYIDNDGDNDADEMDIRYFVDGRLRQVWCGVDLDDDNAMWDLAGYEYSGDFFRSDPYGAAMIYMNKFDPERGAWVPISECPFAFYDPDNDGQSEVVVRVSAVPLAYDPGTDQDYANDPRRYQGAWSDELRRIGVVNIRYSFDVDNLSSAQRPLHYDMGFNLVGATPYRFRGMEQSNPNRRPPQMTCVIPYDRLRGISDRYAADSTGFSWHEFHDDTIVIGAPPRQEDDFRWEGVFWIWERRFMENTGAPNQKWNIRREWRSRPADRRELYYSGVDRRIHLVGAEEGWLEIGHFAGLGAVGEIRMYDSDGNGFFDRWEVYLGDDPLPVRVTTVKNENVRRIVFDDDGLQRFYTQELLPEATAANERLLAALERVHPFSPPGKLAEALTNDCPGHRRYVQDVVRELHYQDFRRRVSHEARSMLAEAKKNDLRSLNDEQRRQGRTSQRGWELVRAVAEMDIAYGRGDYDRVCEILTEIETLRERTR